MAERSDGGQRAPRPAACSHASEADVAHGNPGNHKASDIALRGSPASPRVLATVDDPREDVEHADDEAPVSA